MKRRDLIRAVVSTASLNLLAPLSRAQHKRYVQREGLPAAKAIAGKPSSGDVRIQRLAWAGIKIESDTTTLFVDATSYEEYKDMKLVASTESRHALITHHHSDHYDPAALNTVFDKRSRLYCSLDAVPWMDTRDIRVQPVPLYHPIDVSRWKGNLVAIPVPAVDGFGHPQVSWVVQSNGKKIIHCGDTLWHGYWRDIGIAYGPFDIAFLPINAARLNQGQVKDTGIPALLGPEQAVVAAKLLQARMVCPIHYGRPERDYFETPDPEGNFLHFARERGVAPLLLKQGEYIQWI